MIYSIEPNKLVINLNFIEVQRILSAIPINCNPEDQDLEIEIEIGKVFHESVSNDHDANWYRDHEAKIVSIQYRS